MRADLAIHGFMREFGDIGYFYGIAGGLSLLTDALAASIRTAGGRFFLNTEVTDVSRTAAGEYLVHTESRAPFRADRVILALHVSALRSLPILRDFCTFNYLGMARLTRIYAQYPGSPAWFAGMKRIVTDSPLRYIIPINESKGLIMISYTDDRDTAYWRAEDYADKIQQELRRLFPAKAIPSPLWVKRHEWSAGTTYWKPGHYSIEEETRRALQPRPSTMPELYLCGESFSTRQAWIEGGLEHAELLWNTHLKK
jgi:glycine/D-amino acid oxidase-like deaminating enzyme